ncbi:hypothetical protein HC823_02220 [Candidatus Gracilibacteria bacterium]|nr:hypothetical protein [Candidatus Gracilibacteria bacterium]
MKNILFVLLAAVVFSGCTMPSAQETKTDAPPKMVSEEVSEPSFYQSYTAEKLAALKGTQKWVLFFHADWCPTCRAWEKKVLSPDQMFPEGTVILKVNYDTEKDLVKEYGIKTQSSVVFLDADGEVVETTINPEIEKVVEYFQ